jgi:hypothetical protein
MRLPPRFSYFSDPLKLYPAEVFLMCEFARHAKETHRQNDRKVYRPHQVNGMKYETRLLSDCWFDLQSLKET